MTAVSYWMMHAAHGLFFHDQRAIRPGEPPTALSPLRHTLSLLEQHDVVADAYSRQNSVRVVLPPVVA